MRTVLFTLTRAARHEINESVESLKHDFGAGMSEIPFDSTRVSSSSSTDCNENFFSSLLHRQFQVIHVINER